MTQVTEQIQTLTEAIARRAAITLPVLDTGAPGGAEAALAVINLPGLMRAAPRGAFAAMVTTALRGLPEPEIDGFLDAMSDAAFRDYTATDAAQIRSEHIPPAASQLISLRDGDMPVAQRLIPRIRDQFTRRGIDPTAGMSLVQYFLSSDMHRDPAERDRLLRLLDHWFPRINMHHLFRIFDPKNRLFVARIMEQGAAGAYDDKPRALLHYYWVCVGHDRGRLEEIRRVMRDLLPGLPDPAPGPEVHYRNSLEWISDGRIAHIAAWGRSLPRLNSACRAC
ncbi:hypothetical protein [Paenirhodobacter sp.]|uniref:hypothetical protein n=1 Tax=Paenirhodobacter sp. TaxID=1965326 RepID=UPI003B402007